MKTTPVEVRGRELGVAEDLFDGGSAAFQFDGGSAAFQQMPGERLELLAGQLLIEVDGAVRSGGQVGHPDFVIGGRG
ncbi:hypothetical protein OG473_06785 [Streptomyces anulatus]